MQTFNVMTSPQGYQLRLREESSILNFIADGADKLCAATGHRLERTMPTYRLITWFMNLPEAHGRELSRIPIDKATARQLIDDDEWFEEHEAIERELAAEAAADDATAAGVV
jgi:hypothetical protein